MKKNSLKLSMFVLLSLLTSTLFAQKPATSTTVKPIAELELKMTENGKQWIWYHSDASKGVTKNEVYTFSATHKVTIVTGAGTATDAKSTTSSTWKLTQTVAAADANATAETQPATTTNLTIGTTIYAISFGSDNVHPEYMVLKPVKPAGTVSNYYYSLSAK